MRLIDRDAIAMRAAIALQMRGRVKLKDFYEDSRLPSEQVIDHIVGIVLDEVHAGNAVVIAPSAIVTHPPSGSGVTTISQTSPGEWGVTEPWPDGLKS